MDFGIALATTTDSWRWVRRAEELGFSHAWFYDTQLLNPDVFIGMTQAAMNTEKIRLGTGVLIPSNRIEPVAANAYASLNKIAPGRIDFGVGTGFTGRRTMGLGAITLSRFKTYVERVQALLRGETITWDFEGKERAIRFLNPDFGLINLTDDIPLHISAFGPKSRALTAQFGAGWMNFTGQPETAISDLQRMQESWADANNSGELYSNLFVLGCVLEEGESILSERALAQAGPWATVFLHNLVETTQPDEMKPLLPAALNTALEAYREIYLSYPEAERHLNNHRGHLMKLREDERALLNTEVMTALCGFAATEQQLITHLRSLQAAGYSQFTVQLVEGQEAALEDWARVVSRV
jgi:5,10-methylenetetrahydromethanopterin reductase